MVYENAFLSYLDRPENSKQLYQYFIMITGMLIFYIFSREVYYRGLIVVIAILSWLILIIAFPIPKSAETHINSFSLD